MFTHHPLLRNFSKLVFSRENHISSDKVSCLTQFIVAHNENIKAHLVNFAFLKGGGIEEGSILFFRRFTQKSSKKNFALFPGPGKRSSVS